MDVNRDSKKYKDYIKLQVSKAVDNKQKKHGGLKWEKSFHKKNKHKFAKKVFENCSEIDNILVLGGRWGTDVLALKEAGFKSNNIKAIDLYDPPLSDLVEYGDAHDLSRFYDAKIDLVWIFHVFEHFIEPLTVLDEINKIVSDEAYLAVVVPPFGCRPEKYDMQDEYDDKESFLKVFKNKGYKVVYYSKSLKINNPSHCFIFKKIQKGLDEVKMLFLRGQVPQDRDPKQIMFDSIEDCDDMWTQLAFKLSEKGQGELWYWNGKRKVRYADNFVERWKRSFKPLKNEFSPNIIFARGGFSNYDIVLRRHPKAFKIYYGAGKRFYPDKMFNDYDLILVDTQKQLKKVRRLFPDVKSDLMIKPVAENIFRPVDEEKKYDVILVGNYNNRVNKGHDFAFKRIPEHYNILCSGIVPKYIRKLYPNVTFTGWLPRKELPKLYAQSKVAIVCCGTTDSCPRVIPEAIACDCPILVLDRVNFSQDRYITGQTGMLTNEQDFVKDLAVMRSRYEDFSPSKYYKENLSLSVSSDKILKLVKEK